MYFGSILPLIYALQHCDKSTRKSVINTIKRHHNNPKKVKEVIAFVRESGGLEYAEKSMYAYQAKAIEILSTTPDSEAKTSLQALIKYVIDRKK